MNDTLGNENSSESDTLVINRANSSINLTLNGNYQNITVPQNSYVNITGYKLIGEGGLEIYKNNTLIAQGSSPLSNLSAFNESGTFNVTLYYPQTQNYSTSYLTLYVTVQDNDAPKWSNNATSPVSGSNYTINGVYIFNVTWQDNEGVNATWISHNFTGVLQNYTFNNKLGNVYSYNFTSIAAGNYVWRMYANDSSGNLNQTGVFTFTVERNTSLVNLSLNGTASNITIPQGTTINISATTILGDNANIKLYNEGSLINTGIREISNLTTFNNYGSYNITVIYENTRNFSRSYKTYYVNVAAIYPPSITLNYPGNNSNLSTSGVTFNISAVDDKSATFNCSLYLDGVLNKTNTTVLNSTDTIFVINNINEGLHYWNVSCTDEDNNKNWSETKTFYLDLTQPSLTLVQPEDNQFFADTNLDVNFTYNDDRGINQCYYSINSGSNTTIANCDNITLTAANGVINGTNNFTLYVEDSAGNINYTAITFIVDIVKPNLILNFPENAVLYNSRPLAINVTAIDPAGISAVYYSLNDGANVTIYSRLNETAYTTAISDAALFSNQLKNTSQSFTPAEDMSVKEISILIRRIGSGTTDPKIYIFTDNGSNSPNYSNLVVEQSIQNSEVGSSFTMLNITLDNVINLTANTKYWLTLKASNSGFHYYRWAINLSDIYAKGESSENSNADYIFKVVDYYRFRSSMNVPDNYLPPNTLRVCANDTLGNLNCSVYLNNLQVDATPPEVYNLTQKTSILEGGDKQVVQAYIKDSTTWLNSVLVSFNDQANISMVKANGTTTAGWWYVNYTPTQLNSYNYTITTIDFANNYNFTYYNFTVVDTTDPTISNVTNDPNDALGLDPGVTVDVYANVTDFIIDSVWLYYKFENETNYTVIQMHNYSNVITFYANFTPLYEGNWTYFVYANDTNNNSKYSSLTNLSILNEYSWIRSPPSFGTILANVSQTVSLGTLYVNNTADINLSFDLFAYNPSTGNERTFVSFNITDPFVVEANSYKMILVNATAPASEADYLITIRVNATNATIDPSYLNTTATLRVSSTPTENISVNIIEYDPTVEQEQTGVLMTALVENTGSVVLHNISLNWSIPSDWSVTSGNISEIISTLAVGEKYYSNITATISSTAETGSKTISVSVNTSTNKTDSAQKTVEVSTKPTTTTVTTGGGGGTSAGGGGGGGGISYVKEQKYVNLRVYNENENVVTTLDENESLILTTDAINNHSLTISYVGHDYVTFELRSIPRIFNVKIGQIKEIDVDEDGYTDFKLSVQEINGKSTRINLQRIFARLDLEKASEEIFIFRFKNQYNYTISNLELKIGGYIPEELEVLTPPYKFVEPGETVEFKVRIKAPKVTVFDKYNLITTYAGYMPTSNKFKQQNFFKLFLGKVSPLRANLTLQEAKKIVKYLKDNKLPYKNAEALLEQAKNNLDNLEFSEVAKIVNQIKRIKKREVTINKDILNLQKNIESAKSRGLNPIETNKLLNLAIAAFEREDLDTAEIRLRDANFALILETQGKYSILWIIKTYWYLILIILLGLLLTLYYLSRKIAIIVINQRIKNLIKEQAVISGLIEELQDRYFNKKNIGPTEYHKYMYNYEKRLTRIKAILIRLRTQRIKLVREEKQIKDLERESKELENAIKKVQRAYFVEGKLSRKKYLAQYNELERELAEVEKDKSAIELKASLKRLFRKNKEPEIRLKIRKKLKKKMLHLKKQSVVSRLKEVYQLKRIKPKAKPIVRIKKKKKVVKIKKKKVKKHDILKKLKGVYKK
ncbi:hypothetical protein D6777_02295 [Candidatus Woesearchaeota archaeon]|nr:MAG: hypothetical protein D6777_02295 [Candidatus Woesearchaeota archaeon]